MKLKPRPKIVFRIVDRKNGTVCGSYSRSYHDEYDFESIENARSANCDGEFEQKGLYAIAKYRVTYTLLDPNVDGGEYVPRPTRPEAEVALFDLLWDSWKKLDLPNLPPVVARRTMRLPTQEVARETAQVVAATDQTRDGVRR